MGHDLSFHMVCSGLQTFMSDGKWHLAEAIDLWSPDLLTGTGWLTSLFPEKGAECWAAPCLGP